MVKVTFGGQWLSGMEIMECNWRHERRVVHRMKVWGPEWKALELHKEVFPSVIWEVFYKEQSSRNKRRSVLALGMYALKEANEGIVFFGEKGCMEGCK
jgi:hypothetical protein